MKKIIYILSGIILLSFPHGTKAQEKNTIEKSAFWGNSEAYLHKQAFKMFELVNQALTENPPAIGEPMIRKLALYNLDAMLHETKYDNSEPFNNFLYARINQVIADLAKPASDEVKIYKIYNDGFIARTQSITIAFDLVRGSCNGQTLIPDSLIRLIVDQCDMLLITHNHDDHADPIVAEMFTQKGRTVVGPTNLWVENKFVQHIRSEQVIDKQIEYKEGKQLQMKILPGHQDELMNNIYVVTTKENKTIAHIGDQYNKEDMEWIINIKNQIRQPDALIVNCWTHRMNDLIEGFNPRLVITGHENEMGHTIDHREAFWLTFQKLQQMDKDYVVMGWGEWFSFK